MTLYRLFICTILCFALLKAKAQDSTDEEKPEYKFDSTLKGGYSLYYTTDDSLQYLYLRKGDTLRLIRTDDISNQNRQTMLGFIAADFNDYFILVHALQRKQLQEYPIPCELFEKKTAAKVLEADFITNDDDYILLHNSRSKNDSLRLYNVDTKKIETFAMPTKVEGYDKLINSIELKAITTARLTLIFCISTEPYIEKHKTYKRK